MIKIRSRKKCISIIDVWYAENEINEKGIIRYKEAKKIVTKEYRKVRTLLTDLTEDEETIINKFGKNCRYEIRRAQRENIRIDTIYGKKITEKDIREFIIFFQEFWKSKGVHEIEKVKIEKEIRRYAEANAFAITFASVDGSPIVYHTYIVGEKIIRLYQSASHYRNDISISQQTVGMANRYLHKEDLLWFKGMGKEIYDWGGAGEGEEVVSITKFKESFGGTEAFYYDGEAVKGVAAKVFKMIVNIINFFSK